MAYETLLFEVNDQIATVTLHRPERMNAWNDTMALELGEAMARCDEDDAIRAVIVTGSGRAFCAGADISSGGDTFRATGNLEQLADQRRALAHKYDGYPGPFPFHIRKPVIAAINGHAIGTGMTYPMTCDMRFVAEDAKIQFAFNRRGVAPELWASLIVPRVAGMGIAADLMLTGRMISGRELARLGLANEALPAVEVLPAALARAREVLLAAPVSVAITKRLLWRGLTAASFGEIGREEARMFGWSGQQADAREGVIAFVEKRAPQWKLSVTRDMPEIGSGKRSE
jgi:enoyl-CoA hydratase/carnithine racemase